MSDKNIPDTKTKEDLKKDEPQSFVVNDPQEKITRIMSMENLIKAHMMDLETLQNKLKEQSSMLNDALNNDAEYTEVSGKLKDIARLKKSVKDRILKDPAVAILNEKVQEFRSEMKDTQQALSDYLQQYFQESGMRQITGQDGEVSEIVTVVKLVKKRE